ncbi:MAG: Flp pilus assembly protein CpaB [Gemmatimonadota bacterium]
MSNTFTTRVSGKVSSRGWAIVLGIGAIVLATVLLVVYLDRYRARVGGANAPTPVLVAKQTIPAGTPGTIVTGSQMYAATTLPKKEVEEGAVADPQFFVGRAAAIEILPGQQITATDFAASPTTFVDSQITGTQRAISISIDAVHGSLSQVQAGDSVDIYIAIAGAVKLFRPNVKVLAVPGPEGGTLMLRVDTREAADFAFAADNAQLWFVIRPVAGAKPTVRDTATAATVLR